MERIRLRCKRCRAELEVPWDPAAASGVRCGGCGTALRAERGMLLAGVAPEPVRGEGAGEWKLETFERGYRDFEMYRDNLEYARRSGIPEAAERYRYPRVKGWIVGEFASAPGGLFLDVGSGSAFMAYQIREAYPERELRFVATDVSAEHLRLAAARAGEDSPRFLLPIVCEAEDLVFPDATFDGVTCSEVLEHVFDKRRALAEMARVLRPGGVLLLTTPRRGVVGFWKCVFALPRRAYRLLKGKGWRIRDEVPYDEPVSARELRRMAGEAGLTVEKLDAAACLVHESYLQFLPGFLVRWWVGLARAGERFGLARVVGLHLRLRARKPLGRATGEGG